MWYFWWWNRSLYLLHPSPTPKHTSNLPYNRPIYTTHSSPSSTYRCSSRGHTHMISDQAAQSHSTPGSLNRWGQRWPLLGSGCCSERGCKLSKRRSWTRPGTRHGAICTGGCRWLGGWGIFRGGVRNCRKSLVVRCFCWCLSGSVAILVWRRIQVLFCVSLGWVLRRRRILLAGCTSRVAWSRQLRWWAPLWGAQSGTSKKLSRLWSQIHWRILRLTS